MNLKKIALEISDVSFLGFLLLQADCQISPDPPLVKEICVELFLVINVAHHVFLLPPSSYDKGLEVGLLGVDVVLEDV